MSAPWTITRWLAVIFVVAVVCSGVAVGALVRMQEEASVMALAESRAQATSQHVFEHIYTAMRRGTGREELEEIADRLNHVTMASHVQLIRGEPVVEMYGDTEGSADLREQDSQVRAALETGKSALYRDEDESLRFLYPVILEEECLSCHTGTPGRTVNGVVDVRFPLEGLRAPLGFLTHTAFLGFLGALVLIFVVLFIVVRLLVVRPIHALSDTMARLSEQDTVAHPVEMPRFRARELARLAETFETLMGRIARHRATLEDHARALANAKENAEAARLRADAANVAKSEFLASMSHELRTPLNAILGFSEVLRDQVFGPINDPRYRGYAGDIHESGRHLRDLVDDLLDLARIEAGRLILNLETLNVHDEIDRCLHLFRERATEAGVSLAWMGHPTVPPLVADQRAFRQVMYNLLSNAIKYTPKGGAVRVGVRALPDHIEISVIDTGMGIDKEYHELVFSAYGRVLNVETREIEGTGLGLALVKALMDQHGGTVTLESRKGQGSTFTLRFPRHRADAPGEGKGEVGNDPQDP